MKEIWKDIVGFEGYQVSNTGLVRTHNKTSYTKLHGTRHWKDRILVPKSRKDGKRGGDDRVDLWKNGKPRTIKISRLVAFTFYGKNINDLSLTVNHIDGNWKNNNLSNLELISIGDNIRHGFRNGLYSSCKKIEIIDKETNEKTIYYSISEACRKKFPCKSPKYLHGKIRKGKYEDDKYRWKLLPF